MEIQNTTSSRNTQLQNSNNKNEQEVSFKNEVQNNSEEELELSEEDLTFQKLKNMTHEEINKFYTDKRQNVLLNTLKLSTMFSQNSSMNEAMFNMVSSQDSLEGSQSFLYNMMSNRNSYLSNDGNDHGAWLRKSLIEQIEDPEIRKEQIKIEKEFAYSMLQFDVVSHMNDMMNFSRNERDKEKESSGLFSMFDNTYLQYQNLFDEYEGIENKNSDLLNQKLAMNRINALNF